MTLQDRYGLQIGLTAIVAASVMAIALITVFGAALRDVAHESARDSQSLRHAQAAARADALMDAYAPLIAEALERREPESVRALILRLHAAPGVVSAHVTPGTAGAGMGRGALLGTVQVRRDLEISGRPRGVLELAVRASADPRASAHAVGAAAPAQSLVDRLHSRLTTIYQYIFVFALWGACAAFLIGRLVGKRMSVPIAQLRAAANKFAQGDATVEIDIDDALARDDEIGELASTLAGLAQRLEETMVSRDFMDGVIEAMVDPVLLLDASGRVQRANSAGERLFGRCLKGLTAASLLGDEVAANVQAGQVFEAETRLTTRPNAHRSDRRTEAESTAELIVSSAPLGDRAGAVCVLRDVTEAHRHRDELAAAIVQAQASDRAKSQFLATISHELRTPLNAIIGFSEIIEQRLLGPKAEAEYSSYAGDVVVSARHLLAIINDILDLAKIEAGELALRRSPHDVWRVLRQCARTLEPLARKHGVALSLELDGEEAEVEIDALRFRQIVLNLGSNAIRFTEPGGTIALRGHLDEARLQVSVTDTGVGMSDDEVRTALQPFKQVSADLARTQAGVGLGLPIAKRFVELHGGLMHITSAPQKGTRIDIDLPRCA